MSGETIEVQDAGAGPAPFRPAWLVLALSILFGLFYAWDAWEAVGNLLSILQIAGSLDASLSVLGWSVLVASILVPVAIFVAALFIARRRSALQLAAVLFAGLCVSSAIWFDLISQLGLGALLA